ncbi:MAG: hypothetical protein UY56_C0005G0035 [Parcubacteria group bacterium GW2011_GWA1_50_14]|uniref:Plasmid stabilization protein n=1 Tax=Candidatus Liptonbacteria bacterium GWB1_49_6 TaxID=1798644 RepID=A0A1G2C4Y5_9BACT|nr:MAG: hypothetical protein UY56_C0005G0035 [Parcubacteria group bacterium GW2011_GWA1_50_14]OGY96474.1 MAG: hypothetical protein A2122_02130 [Candidatus Liptonbacteria bacterium GWB1_49_6]
MKDWRVFITPAAERALKKLPQEVRQFVLEGFSEKIRANPFLGDQLSGPLAWLRSFHFSSKGKPYRVVYNVESETSRVIIYYAGHRAEFYERLRKHLREWKK